MPFRRHRGFARIERGEAIQLGLTRGKQTRSVRSLLAFRDRGHKVWVDLRLHGDEVRGAKTMGFYIADVRINDGRVEVANSHGDYVAIRE